MPVILEYGVLKSELCPVEHLCPIAVAWTSEDPALVVFILNYEYPETGNQNVIDLGGAIFQAKR